MDRRHFVKSGAAMAGGALAASATSGLAASGPNSLYPDKLYTEPYIDKDEWRDRPIRHRYVHGGFRGTDLLFSMYFPPKEQYSGRFFHPVMHIAGQENVAYTGRLAGLDGDSIQFAAASGGYLVESNLGSKIISGPADIVNFRASAATAQFGRMLAAKMYGEHRPYGYIYGGSGGSYKTMGAVENTNRVWDGCVPFIHGCPVSLPNMFTVQAHALRVLQGKFEGIVDAIAPGGGGDMYAGLDEEQREALREVTRMGFPPRAWFAHERLAFNYTAVFASVVGTLLQEDPAYFQDFWSKPGYLGASPPQSMRDARVQQETRIKEIITTDRMREMGMPVGITAGTRGSAPAGFRLESMPRKRLQGSFLFPRTGAGVGQRLMITGVIGNIAMLGYGGEHIPKLEAMRPGDTILIDNSDYLAAQTYHRHQNPPAEYYVWDQFRGSDGKPIYPQRPLVQGYNQAGEGNSFQSGRFDCKMITVNCMMDEAAYPWQPDWYRKRVRQYLGARYGDNYRLWYLDNCMHVNPSRYLMPTEGEAPAEDHSTADTQIVSYAGTLQQALRDVAAWAEKGVAPPQETSYRQEDGQIFLPPKAGERRGIQPVVALTANGGPRADIKTGQPVQLVGGIELPPGGGGIVSAEWDYDGSGAYADTESFTDLATARTVRRTKTFDKPGTYFIALRVSAQRKDAIGTSFAKLRNLGRVRVVVT